VPTHIYTAREEGRRDRNMKEGEGRWRRDATGGRIRKKRGRWEGKRDGGKDERTEGKTHLEGHGAG
jgi:hypothetical protein